MAYFQGCRFEKEQESSRKMVHFEQLKISFDNHVITLFLDMIKNEVNDNI